MSELPLWRPPPKVLLDIVFGGRLFRCPPVLLPWGKNNKMRTKCLLFATWNPALGRAGDPMGHFTAANFPEVPHVGYRLDILKGTAAWTF